MKPRFAALLILFCVVAGSCKSHKNITASPPPPQVKTDSASYPPVPGDMQVTITEGMINKCFTALGPVSGKELYRVMFVNDTFTWTLINPQIILHNGSAEFTTNVSVVAGAFTYTTPCSGSVDIWYDRQKNLINVKIRSCIVSIYTKVLGTKYHISDIDIANRFTDPFTFEGPTASSSETDMDMPDGTVRKLYMITTDCDLSVLEKKIVVPCSVKFSLTPPEK